MSSLRLCLMIQCVAALSATVVHGHESLSHRHAASTFRLVNGDALEMDTMVTLQLTGRRALLIQQRFDLDRDGRFSKVESTMLGAELQRETIGGLTFQCAGKSLVIKSVKHKVHRKGSQSVVSAFLLSFDVPQVCMKGLQVIAEPKAQRKGLENLDLIVATIPPLNVNQKRQIRLTLKPGASHTFSLSN